MTRKVRIDDLEFKIKILSIKELSELNEVTSKMNSIESVYALIKLGVAEPKMTMKDIMNLPWTVAAELAELIAEYNVGKIKKGGKKSYVI